ncbi:hypothetical protein FOL47_009565 [Perkinsus chesapeaki]|uniref:Uncharacterized protein n=1 Tax=Perkinsus chesapeaki TaxID=330153 RepID=A0A7J6L7D6_PERCH|nr:hypothetical protein FOL47_009565 [Perkinsus chesapeaki]
MRILIFYLIASAPLVFTTKIEEKGLFDHFFGGLFSRTKKTVDDSARDVIASAKSMKDNAGDAAISVKNAGSAVISDGRDTLEDTAEDVQSRAVVAGDNLSSRAGNLFNRASDLAQGHATRAIATGRRVLDRAGAALQTGLTLAQDRAGTLSVIPILGLSRISLHPHGLDFSLLEISLHTKLSAEGLFSGLFTEADVARITGRSSSEEMANAGRGGDGSGISSSNRQPERRPGGPPPPVASTGGSPSNLREGGSAAEFPEDIDPNHNVNNNNLDFHGLDYWKEGEPYYRATLKWPFDQGQICELGGAKHRILINKNQNKVYYDCPDGTRGSRPADVVGAEALKKFTDENSCSGAFEAMGLPSETKPIRAVLDLCIKLFGAQDSGYSESMEDKDYGRAPRQSE